MPIVPITSLIPHVFASERFLDFERTADRFACSLATRLGMARCGGFFWWIWLITMLLARIAFLFFDEKSASAQTP